MITILSAIIVLLLIVIYYLYNQNTVLRNKEIEEIVEIQTEEIVEAEDTEIIGAFEEKEETLGHQPYDPIAEVLINRKVTKAEAIGIVNSFLGRHKLSNANTNFSNLNKAKPVWWFDINRTRFSNDLHLILAKQKDFIWIKIPKGAVKDPSKTFYIRADNGLVQLVISSERGIHYLRDIGSGASGFNFEQYIEMEFD